MKTPVWWSRLMARWFPAELSLDYRLEIYSRSGKHYYFKEILDILEEREKGETTELPKA